MRELHAGEGTLGSLEGFESEHGTREPFDGSMVLFHDIVQVFHLPDDDGRAMRLVVALDRGFIGVTAVNGDGRGEPVAADRLGEKL